VPISIHPPYPPGSRFRVYHPPPLPILGITVYPARVPPGFIGMAKRKSGSNSGEGTVYREFGKPDAMARAVPDRPPQQQQLRVQASRKGRKGKTVTLISGFQHQPDTLNTLAKDLKAQCGTGGTVKDGTIEIQGDHAQKLVDLLAAKGYQVKRSGS
jgi:translation initiation factor 1